MGGVKMGCSGGLADGRTDHCYLATDMEAMQQHSMPMNVGGKMNIM
jgi:hypothetical protein